MRQRGATIIGIAWKKCLNVYREADRMSHLTGTAGHSTLGGMSSTLQVNASLSWFRLGGVMAAGVSWALHDLNQGSRLGRICLKIRLANYSRFLGAGTGPSCLLGTQNWTPYLLRAPERGPLHACSGRAMGVLRAGSGLLTLGSG